MRRRAIALAGAATVLLAACGPGTGTPGTGTSGPGTSGPGTPGGATSTGPAPAAAAARWIPAPGTPWQWQLTTPVDTTVNVPIYDIDGTENGPDVVRALHAAGRKVICYVNAGAVEDFRPDHDRFPAALRGNSDRWAGERWLDIRRTDVLGPLMAARFDACRAAGFDAIEADLVDGYTNDTGFPLTAGDQLAYNRILADLAHRRGLSIALKNDLEQVPDLVNDFDFAIDEQCAEYQECAELTPFIRQHKAVLQVEYNLDNAGFCPQATALSFSSMRKNADLDAARWPCP